MRAVVSRVSEAEVKADGRLSGRIGPGLVIFLGIAQGDSREDALYLAQKCCSLRIFEDAEGKMNLSATEVGGAVMVISNFTLCGDCRKGKRPNFTGAARPQNAQPLYEYFLEVCRSTGLEVAAGVFGADMKVCQNCDGPITLVVDSTAHPSAVGEGAV